jgi:RimJ/RimL family protein N-acetyltransferase
VRFLGIADESEVDRLVALGIKREPLAYWVTSALKNGESRPAWCRMALSDAGELLAAHVFDSWSGEGDPGDVPTFVQLLGHVDEAAAVALLAHDLSAFDASVVEARVVIESDASPSLRAQRDRWPAILEATGFMPEVDRVRLTWPADAPVPRPSSRLTFVPPSEFPESSLLRIFAEVADGSVDNSQRAFRASAGRDAEAAGRLRHALNRDFPAWWFVIGVDAAGEPVGYAQSARVHGNRAILAELGVVQSQRGRRYAHDLLAYGTAAVLDAGVTMITSDTDEANHFMRAAFARAGYREFATRHDFRWVRPRTTG